MRGRQTDTDVCTYLCVMSIDDAPDSVRLRVFPFPVLMFLVSTSLVRGSQWPPQLSVSAMACQGLRIPIHHLTNELIRIIQKPLVKKKYFDQIKI